MSARTTGRAPVMLVAASLLIAAVWGASVGMRVSAQAPTETPASKGVYTDVQAGRGKTIFDASCSMCHDTVKFSGPQFASAWAGKPLTDLFHAVKSMPEDNPGSLKPQEYADILAYFLKMNDYPAGPTELPGTDAAIAAVKIDAKTP